MTLARFTGRGKVQAELSNGQTIECTVDLKAEGDYKEWWEPAPVEWGYSYQMSEYDIDEETIALDDDPQYFDTDEEIPDDVVISKIIKVIDIDDIEWEVQDGWQDDGSDTLYDAWKDNQVA